MKHLDEGALQALLDGELPAGEARAAEAHLAVCAACTHEMAELRSVHELLGRGLALADVTPPVATAQMAIRGRRARVQTQGWLGESRRALLRAAALVALVAGAASAAVPGTPINRWLRDTTGLEPHAEIPTEQPVARRASPAPAPPAPASGVSIFPEDGSVRVVLNDPSRGLKLRARLQPGGRAEVAAAGDASDARFRTGPGRIEVSDAGPGEVTVVLPAEATAAVVEVDGRTVVAKDGDRLVALAGAASLNDSEAEYQVGP